MSDKARLSATIHGRVQGVYFRGFVYDHAVRRSLVGYVRNLPDGTAVEVYAEGEAQELERLLELLKLGPPGARIVRVEFDWKAPTGEFNSFEIRNTWT